MEAELEALPVRQSEDPNDIVCLCAGVPRGRIKSAIAIAPASTLESLGAQLGCGVQCGCCRPLLQEMLGHSPWYEVANATRTTLTDDHDPDRRIVQIDMQLPGYPPYPQAQPAQHVVVQAWLDNSWVTRTYTVVQQSEDGNTVSIAIRRIQNGQFSARLLDADDDEFAGIPLRIAIPSGDADPGDGRPVVCFAAGVGVTLALSLLHGARPGHVLHVDYSASRRGDMVYADHIEACASSSNTISCHLRHDDTDGFIDNEDIFDTTTQFPGARYYVCGPQAYTRRVVDWLRRAGVDERDIRIEAFFLKTVGKPRPTIRRLAYAAGLMLAFIPLALLAPALARFVPNEAHNPGHEQLACADCHRDAPGTTRQQLQAKAKHLLGMRPAGADFGMQKMNNATCIRCHDNPDDQHPAHRFLEPRFEDARRTLAPQICTSCHREHTDTRLSQTNAGFCSTCHSDMKVKDDVTRPTHAVLVQEKRWGTCLGCHDFHGNHAHDPPHDLKDAITPAVIAEYMRRDESPYGERIIKAKQPEASP